MALHASKLRVMSRISRQQTDTTIIRLVFRCRQADDIAECAQRLWYIVSAAGGGSSNLCCPIALCHLVRVFAHSLALHLSYHVHHAIYYHHFLFLRFSAIPITNTRIFLLSYSPSRCLTISCLLELVFRLLPYYWVYSHMRT